MGNVKHKKTKKRLAILAVLAVFAILSRAALSNSLTVREYVVESALVSEPHTFVVVSDLHSTWYGEGQRELIEAIDACAPEAVFMPGDFAQAGRSLDSCRFLTKMLSGRYPCYFTTGNHDRWAEGTDDMKGELASCGAVVLSDSTENLTLGGDRFRIHGVDDPLFYESTEDFMSAVSSLDLSEDCVDILLSHRPEFAELYALCGFDITVSGHAHGGQVRIPFLLNGLYAPNQGWFPQYAGGDYAIGNTHLIVSRGLMIDDLPRVFNPPELVVITIVPLE